MVDALEQAVRDDGLKSVQLQLTGLGRETDRDIVSDHLEGNLVDDLGDDRFSLPGMMLEPA